MLAFGPDLGIAEPMLLQHFHQGLKPELAILLETSSGGSFAHLTVEEGNKVLDKILENTPYTGVYDEFPEEDPDELTQEVDLSQTDPSIPTSVTNLLLNPLCHHSDVQNISIANSPISSMMNYSMTSGRPLINP